VLGSFAMTASAMAAAPAGTACQTDGKISGRGSTLQANAITAEIGGYNTNVCGAVGSATDLNTGVGTDPAGSNMIVYNWGSSTTANSPTAAGARGSGEGLAAMACRTDAFGGTDIPYNFGDGTTNFPTGGTMPWLWQNLPAANPANWPWFDPAFGEDGSNGCDTFYNTTHISWVPPYGPAPNAGCANAGPACYPSTVGGVTNNAAPVMSFPIAVASAALGVNFNVPAPQLTLGTNSGTGGTARCWTITALNASGQSTASVTVGPANVGAGETQVLNWSEPTPSNPTGYDIYATGVTGTTCNAFTTPALLTTISSGATTTFTDTGTATTAGAPPTTNTAHISGCPTTAAAADLTSSEVSTIFSGDTTNWDQLTPASTWSGCNLAIQRIVRGDISGTTQEMKTYLKSVDPNRALCNGGGQTWSTLAVYTSNTDWPGDQTACSGVTAPINDLGTGGGAACPGFPLPAGSTKGVICGVAATEGAVTYGDLSNWKSTPNVMYVDVNSNTGNPQGPGSSTVLGTGTPNCSTAFSGNLPGAGGSTDMVGLDANGAAPAGTDWSTDAVLSGSQTVPASNITNIPGSNTWPICTLTYDMVYSGLSAGSAGTTAIGGMNNDKRRTLYTFFTFLLSPDGQSFLRAAGYLPIPSSWASLERTGFEGGF
jgi:ABC-type phosphate transport system substrate-binding protein